MEFRKKKFEKMFPNLAEEMSSEENKVEVNSVRTDTEAAEKTRAHRFAHYSPDAIDFIRRCDSAEQAEEVITYLERRGEVDKEYASKLRKQLKEKGVRSFGEKKENDYYLKHGHQQDYHRSN
jgi:hypothetical protein